MLFRIQFEDMRRLVVLPELSQKYSLIKEDIYYLLLEQAIKYAAKINFSMGETDGGICENKNVLIETVKMVLN